jgi:hypothetical protein
LSVKPEKKISVEDVSRLLGSYYEGTALSMADRHKIPNPKKRDKDDNIVESEPDSITSEVSNPWMRNDEVAMYNGMGDSGATNGRTVSMPWCAYSKVTQQLTKIILTGQSWNNLSNLIRKRLFPKSMFGTIT